MAHDTPEDEDVDPGEPLELLASLRVDPPSGFLPRIRSGIQRRVATAQLLDFAINGVFSFLQGIGDLLFGILNPPSAREGDGRDE